MSDVRIAVCLLIGLLIGGALYIAFYQHNQDAQRTKAIEQLQEQTPWMTK